ncbi:binary toxin-like calcium binding domain-containing protein [Clostridium botulinum]|uniref:binary toxin-like calcium binding domain-containing protein n=1 Tax=Clostridium botulinum TaxID=1491 RepID=UPI0004D7F0B5|nr:binary toxin-like calcium binding domain-containing protein [Clostridium botulinum]KEH95957.1 C2 toxin, component II [Clostridium botulinum C/D str. Sp77]
MLVSKIENSVKDSNKNYFTINGLMGYYFENDFFNLNIISPTLDGNLTFSKEDINSILGDKSIKSARWIGLIKPSITGEYILSTNSPNCRVELNGEIFNLSLNTSNTVNLIQGNVYDIRIEQLMSENQLLKNYEGIKLYWETSDIIKEIIPSEVLLKPNYSNTNQKSKFIPNNTLFSNAKLKANANKGTDSDGIPDEWEVNGYTVMNQKAVAWDDKFAANGYKKYVSNPFKPSTANDPYTDFEKVSGQIDPSVSTVARDPMISAYPIVGVQMERLVVSKSETITVDSTKSMSKSTSYSSTNINTVGAEISGNLELAGGIFPVFNMSASANYSHTLENTSTVDNTTGESFSQGLSINTGESAYINPNIRYYNTGTAPVYNVTPNTTIVIDKQSVATIKGQESLIGDYLNPSGTYPIIGQPPIALNTMDQSSSRLIPINYNQLKSIDNGGTVMLSTSQFTGNFAKYNSSGNLVTDGNNWEPYLGTIKSTTVSLTLSFPDQTTQVAVVAPNFSDPEDRTPRLTLEQALVKAFGLEKKNDKFYFQGIEITENQKIQVFLDNNTNIDFQNQLKNTADKDIMHCIIKRNMNILVKVITFKENISSINIINDTNFGIQSMTGLSKRSKGQDGIYRASTKSFSFRTKKINHSRGYYKIRFVVQCSSSFTCNFQLFNNQIFSRSFHEGFFDEFAYFKYDGSNSFLDISCNIIGHSNSGVFLVEVTRIGDLIQI